MYTNMDLDWELSLYTSMDLDWEPRTAAIVYQHGLGVAIAYQLELDWQLPLLRWSTQTPTLDGSLHSNNGVYKHGLCLWEHCYIGVYTVFAWMLTL